MNDVFYQPNLGELPQYDTELFCQVWPTFDDFLTDYSDSAFKTDELDGKERLIYSLLVSYYGRAPIANSTVSQFKIRVFEKIYSYGPTWNKTADIQRKLRAMSEDELRAGGKNVSNFAINPNTKPATSSTEELDFISQQTSRNHKRGRVDAYANLLALLDEDVNERFMERFRPLFRKVVRPAITAIYPNE